MLVLARTRHEQEQGLGFILLLSFYYSMIILLLFYYYLIIILLLSYYYLIIIQLLSLSISHAPFRHEQVERNYRASAHILLLSLSHAPFRHEQGLNETIARVPMLDARIDELDNKLTHVIQVCVRVCVCVYVCVCDNHELDNKLTHVIQVCLVFVSGYIRV